MPCLQWILAFHIRDLLRRAALQPQLLLLLLHLLVPRHISTALQGATLQDLAEVAPLRQQLPQLQVPQVVRLVLRRGNGAAGGARVRCGGGRLLLELRTGTAATRQQGLQGGFGHHTGSRCIATQLEPQMSHRSKSMVSSMCSICASLEASFSPSYYRHLHVGALTNKSLQLWGLVV